MSQTVHNQGLIILADDTVGPLIVQATAECLRRYVRRHRRPSGGATVSVPRGVALLVAGALFMEILDATIITPAIPLIASSLGVDAVDVSIAISAYLVTVAVLIPVSGWMADRFGTRRVFIAAIAVFTLASVGCAVSVSLPMLVAMRVVPGVGGALMVPAVAFLCRGQVRRATWSGPSRG